MKNFLLKKSKILCILLVFFLFFCLTNQLSNASETVYFFNGALYSSLDGINITATDDVKILEPSNSYYSRYTDKANGFSCLIPKGMITNVTLSPVVTRFYDDNTSIDIYIDDFTNTNSNAYQYVNYSNNFLKNSKYHQTISNYTEVVNGRSVHVLKWTRPLLSKVPNDKNYYASLEFIIDSNHAYTIIIKSKYAIDIERDIMNSFYTMNREGTPQFSKRVTKSITPLNEETKNFYNEYFSEDSKLVWGIFEMSAPLDFRKLEKIEGAIGYTFPFLVYYHTLDDLFPVRVLDKSAANNRYMEITFQTFHMEKDNQGLIYEILNGKYDDYLRQYAKSMSQEERPVLFRFNNEMNGDWCLYSAYYYSKDPELYRALWKYLHGIFVEEGVKNVLWVFNPHDLSFPPFAWNHYLNYYPGDEYVDIIGLTGYNTGNYFPGEKWREFSEIYPSLYHEYDKLFKQPFMITEFGSNSVGGDKVAWINKMFVEMGQFDRIKVAIWWNGIDFDSQGRPGRIYRLDETPEIMNAFKEGFKKTQNQ